MELWDAKICAEQINKDHGKFVDHIRYNIDEKLIVVEWDGWSSMYAPRATYKWESRLRITDMKDLCKSNGIDLNISGRSTLGYKNGK